MKKATIILMVIFISFSCGRKNNEKKSLQNVKKVSYNFGYDSLMNLINGLVNRDSIDKSQVLINKSNYREEVLGNKLKKTLTINDNQNELQLIQNYKSNKLLETSFYLNKRKISKFISTDNYSDIDLSDFDFSNYTAPYYIEKYIIKGKIYYLLQGSSLSAQGIYSTVIYNFFFDPNNNKCYLFSGIQGENEFYIGYSTIKKEPYLLDNSINKNGYLLLTPLWLSNKSVDTIKNDNKTNFFFKIGLNGVYDSLSTFKTIDFIWGKI